MRWHKITTRATAIKMMIMKKILFLLLGFLMLQAANAQLQPQLENPDAEPNCKMIRNNSFLNREPNGKNTPDYQIVFSDGIVTEYLEGGKYYVRTKVTFTSPCEYTSTVVEVTKPHFSIKVGDTFRTTILATSTANGLIKIKIQMNGTTNFIILEQIKKS